MKLLDYVDYYRMFWEIFHNTKADLNTSTDEVKIRLKDFYEDYKLGGLEAVNGEEYKNGNIIYISYGETGGQNESDTQGWSRDYTLGFDYIKEKIVSCEYEQG